MNIVVCVKYVPDATADRHFEDDNTVDRVGVDGLLSELDEYAVEQALQIKEKLGDDTEVTVLSVGPEQATDAIRKALQMGADKGVHVVDDAIAGSDALATSLVLAEAVKKIDASWDLRGVRHGLHRRLDGRAAGDAGRAARRPGRHARLRGRASTAPRSGSAATATPPPRPSRARCRWCCRSPTSPARRATRPSRASWPRRRSRWRPGRWPTSASTPSWSACPPPGAAVEGTEARPPRTAGEVVTDEDGSGATALVEFLASKKFI